MPERKKYLINNREFFLKDSLTTRDKINNSAVFKKMNFDGSSFEVADCSLNEVNGFLKTILIPVDGVAVDDADFFSDINEDVELEVMGDFFLKRLEKTNTTQNYLKSLMSDMMKLQKN